MAYGASLESWLGASPHGFESHILRSEKAPDKSGAFIILRLIECSQFMVTVSLAE